MTEGLRCEGREVPSDGVRSAPAGGASRAAAEAHGVIRAGALGPRPERATTSEASHQVAESAERSGADRADGGPGVAIRDRGKEGQTVRLSRRSRRSEARPQVRRSARCSFQREVGTSSRIAPGRRAKGARGFGRAGRRMLAFGGPSDRARESAAKAARAGSQDGRPSAPGMTCGFWAWDADFRP